MTSSMVVGRVCIVRAFQNLTTPHRRSFASLIKPPDVKLYQYQICPFCNITKSVISHAEIDYTSVEVNPLTKAELKPWSGDYKKVPIALIDGCQANGSEEILNSILNTPFAQHMLKERWGNNKHENDKGSEIMTMETFRQSKNAQKWLRFAIDDLAALLYPNICSTLSDSYNAFGYVKDVDTFTSLQKITIQSLGAVAMYIAAGKIKSKRNITDEKKALEDALDKYESEGLQSGKFIYSSGLASPDLGDLSVFGVLYAVRGLNAHHTAIQLRGGHVQEWYDRMTLQVLRGGSKIDLCHSSL